MVLEVKRLNVDLVSKEALIHDVSHFNSVIQKVCSLEATISSILICSVDEGSSPGSNSRAGGHHQTGAE